jgi:hypothetical protein
MLRARQSVEQGSNSSDVPVRVILGAWFALPPIPGGVSKIADVNGNTHREI